MVSGESGRCLYMSSSVSPSQVVRWKCFIARKNVEDAGLNHTAWRNRDNYFLVLFIWKIELDACDG